ncbi:MAG: KpsF/GutQ family sugar-phosphate isomerase [Myxococcota bacterium]|nr:KpsF/GutQ family sugar-phosphate isomerase [Myxococcota bacterium]
MSFSEFEPSQIQNIGRQVLRSQSAALASVEHCLDDSFVSMVEMIVNSPGRLVVTGMGKAGFIAQKISATFASTGTPSLFLHPADAVHGDLGRIGPGDVVLALSHSGETEEMTRLLVPLERVSVPVLAITARKESSLGRGAKYCLAMGKVEEAGNGLAPTTSTTLMLALGDALSMAVQDCRGFTADQFAQFHPGGALGRKLMKVHEVMRQGEMLPVLSVEAKLPEVLAVMTETQGRPGACMITEKNGALVGMFTDGDLRRLLESNRFEASQTARDIMIPNPKTVRPDQQVTEAAKLLRTYHVDQVPVVDAEHRPVGLLDVQDLLSLKFL